MRYRNRDRHLCGCGLLPAFKTPCDGQSTGPITRILDLKIWHRWATGVAKGWWKRGAIQLLSDAPALKVTLWGRDIEYIWTYIYLLYYIYRHMISIYQPNKVDKLTLLSRSFKLEVREFVAWDNLVWISGPRISVAKCCALSFCKTKGCKHLDGKKRCTYIDSHYISTHSITLLPPTFPSIFHLSISSFRHGNLPFFSMNLYTSSIIHVQLHPSSFAKA